MNNNEDLDIPVAYEIPNNTHIVPENLAVAYEINVDYDLESNPIIINEINTGYNEYTKVYIKIAFKISVFFTILLFMYLFLLK